MQLSGAGAAPAQLVISDMLEDGKITPNRPMRAKYTPLRLRIWSRPE